MSSTWHPPLPPCPEHRGPRLPLSADEDARVDRDGLSRYAHVSASSISTPARRHNGRSDVLCLPSSVGFGASSSKRRPRRGCRRVPNLWPADSMWMTRPDCCTARHIAASPRFAPVVVDPICRCARCGRSLPALRAFSRGGHLEVMIYLKLWCPVGRRRGRTPLTPHPPAPGTIQTPKPTDFALPSRRSAPGDSTGAAAVSSVVPIWRVSRSRSVSSSAHRGVPPYTPWAPQPLRPPEVPIEAMLRCTDAFGRCGRLTDRPALRATP